MPPSAITVCALPSSDLHTRPVFAPASAAAIAARRPAPPAPITKTSTSCVSYSAISARPSDDLEVVDVPLSQEPDVQVGQRHHEQADPGQEHVPLVELADALPQP